MTRGAIICEAAYAQGKMLKNSSWTLSRSITPSDIDLVVESKGCFLWVELTRHAAHWGQLNTGQRRMYDALSMIPGLNLVCLAHHSVSVNRQIDTCTDIVSVDVRWDCGSKSIQLDGAGWRFLVRNWVISPRYTLAWLNEEHARSTN